MARVALTILALLALAAPAHALTIREQQCFYMRHDSDGCRRTNGMQGALDAVVSPDGRNVYAVSGFQEYGALLSFRRDPRTGTLTQLAGRHGCVSNDGRNAQANLDPGHGIGLPGRCAKAGPMAGAQALAIAPDGRTIYVLGSASFRRDGDSITVFRRDPRSGFVHEVQCWTRLGTPHCPKTLVGEPRALAITPDGRELVVGGTALVTFAVDAGGRLSAPAVVRQSLLPFADALAAAPDGATVYAAGGSSATGELLALARDPATGVLTARACVGTVAATCPGARALGSPRDVAVAPDGAGVYVAAADLEEPEGARPILHSSALAAFSGDPLAETGCSVYEGRTKNPGCSTGPGLYEAQTIAITPDGRHAVASFIDSAAVLLLDRDPATQRLTPLAGRRACVRAPHNWVDFKVTLPCNPGHGLYAPQSVTVSPDGRNAYLASGDGLAVFALR